MAAAREMYGRAAWTIAFALVLYYINHREYPGPALQLTAVIILIGLGFVGAGYGLSWLAGPGRQRVLDQVLDSLQLQGSERVLDAGSAGGQLALAVARRLQSGKVIALGETAENEAPRELAKNEGLGDRIRFESADWKKLSYPDGNFDAVICSRMLNSLETDALRISAVREMVRVLKPGGKLALNEVGDAQSILRALSESGIPNAHTQASNLPFGLGGRLITAQKSR
jgi:SAM-dependent methyltransferase